MTKKTQRPSWRDQIEIHPAADLFPLMSETDPAGLQAMADSIAKNLLKVPDLMPVIHAELSDRSSDLKLKWKFSLLDGRNRLDAMELAGIKFTLRPNPKSLPSAPGWLLDVEGHVASHVLEIETGDAWEYARRANVERRLLNGREKRELIKRLLKATPEKSDRAIARMVKGHKNTVKSIRAKEEARGQIAHVKTRVDTKGRKSPARKKTKTTSRRRSAGTEHAKPKAAAANKLHRELMHFQQTFTEKFKAWVATKPADEGLDEIHNALRLVTEELLQLATSINEVPAPAAVELAAPAVTAPSKPPLQWGDGSTGELWTGDMEAKDLVAHAADGKQFEIRQYMGRTNQDFLVRVTIKDKLKTLQQALDIAEAYNADPAAPPPKKAQKPKAAAVAKPEPAAPAPRVELTPEESAAERKAQHAAEDLAIPGFLLREQATGDTE